MKQNFMEVFGFSGSEGPQALLYITVLVLTQTDGGPSGSWSTVQRETSLTSGESRTESSAEIV